MSALSSLLVMYSGFLEGILNSMIPGTVPSSMAIDGGMAGGSKRITVDPKVMGESPLYGAH